MLGLLGGCPGPTTDVGLVRASLDADVGSLGPVRAELSARHRRRGRSRRADDRSTRGHGPPPYSPGDPTTLHRSGGLRPRSRACRSCRRCTYRASRSRCRPSRTTRSTVLMMSYIGASATLPASWSSETFFPWKSAFPTATVTNRWSRSSYLDAWEAHCSSSFATPASDGPAPSACWYFALGLPTATDNAWHPSSWWILPTEPSALVLRS